MVFAANQAIEIDKIEFAMSKIWKKCRGMNNRRDFP
jgi:hypothetical protein